MNPDTPKNPREEMEVRVTALLMGELSEEEAAALREEIAADPALAALHARLGQVVGLLREASADAGGPAPAEPLRLSPGRREQLLAQFKTVSARASAAARRDWRPFIQLGLAAALVALIGGAMMLPRFAALDQRVGMTRNLYDTVDEYDFSLAAPAPEAAAEVPAVQAPNATTWAAQPGAVRAFSGSSAAGQRGEDVAGAKPEAEVARLYAYAELPATVTAEAAKTDHDRNGATVAQAPRVTGTRAIAPGAAPAAATPAPSVLAFTPEAPAIPRPLATAGKVMLLQGQAGGTSGSAAGRGKDDAGIPYFRGRGIEENGKSLFGGSLAQVDTPTVNGGGLEISVGQPASGPEQLKQLGAITAAVAGREVSQSETLGELPTLGTAFRMTPPAPATAAAAPSGPPPAGVTALGVTDGGLAVAGQTATAGARRGGEKTESRDPLAAPAETLENDLTKAQAEAADRTQLLETLSAQLRQKEEALAAATSEVNRYRSNVTFSGTTVAESDSPQLAIKPQTAPEFDRFATNAVAETKPADGRRNLNFGAVADSKARSKDWSGQIAPSDETRFALGDLLQDGTRPAHKGKPVEPLEKKAKGLEEQMERMAKVPVTELPPGDFDRGLSKHVDGLVQLEEPALRQQDYYNKSISRKPSTNVEQTKQFFADADGFYQTGRYDLALKRTAQILNADPYNLEARKMQEKINKAVDAYGMTSYNETRSRIGRNVDTAGAIPSWKFNRPLAQFWTDDESVKLNINTASEGNLWGTPAAAEAEINQARNIARKELGDRMELAKKQLEEVKKLDEEIKDTALSGKAREEKTRQRGEKASQLEAMDREIREFQASREEQLQEQSVRLRTASVHDAPAQSAPAPQLVAADAGSAELSRNEMIQKKLERIIVPKIELKEATVAEALDFLKKKSVELDTTEPVPANRGINIVLKRDAGGAPPAPAEPAPSSAADARITLSLSNIPMSEAVRYVSSLAGLEYKVEPYAVAFAPASAGADTVITREFKVSPEIIKKAFTEAVRGGAEITQHDVAKEFLAANGVAFGPLALAFYVPSDSKLIVRNTEAQLALIGPILSTAESERAVEKEEAKKAIVQDTPAKKPAQPAPVPQPEIATRTNPLSTFSLNVTDVSFKLAEASLEKGQMPDAATVRSEEFINAFDYRDLEPAAGAPLAFASERARYPFAQNRDLLRLSVQTAAAGRAPGRALNVVLLLDASGSMERADRVNIVREALRVLAAQMHAQDKLSVITFARTPRLWIDGVSGDKAAESVGRVGEITPQGGTNIEAALDLGFATAKRHFQPGSINRVVLMTDGAANLGDVNPDALKAKVETQRKQGIALDAFGVGWEGFDDSMLEALSRNGDGRYGFINTPEAAANEFAAQLAGALRVAASDVKVQVEFNPKRVAAYRQIGYAKHQLTKEQFRDNTVDAAEIGAAESGNALYTCEVNPRGEGDIATVRVRFKVPGTSDYREHEWTVPFTAPAPPLDQASPTLRLAGTASAFSEMLAGSPFAAEVTSDALLGLINGVPAVFANDPRPQKLEWMIRQAKSLVGR